MHRQTFTEKKKTDKQVKREQGESEHYGIEGNKRRVKTGKNEKGEMDAMQTHKY